MRHLGHHSGGGGGGGGSFTHVVCQQVSICPAEDGPMWACIAWPAGQHIHARHM